MTFAFTLFDLRNFATTQPMRLIIPLAFVVVLGLTLPVPGLPIVGGAIVASLTASYHFQGDERGLLDTLYASTPVSRRAVVTGRYLSVLALSAVLIGLGTATMLVVDAVHHQGVHWPIVADMLLVAFGVVAVALSVQLPWFFAMGFTRGRPLTYIPVGIMSIAGWIAAQSGLLDGTVRFDAPATPPSALVTATVLVVGAGLLVASAAVAARRYQRREL